MRNRQDIIDEVISQMGGRTQGSKIMIKSLSEILTKYLREGSADNKLSTQYRDEVSARPLRRYFRRWNVANLAGNNIINGKKVRDYREWRKQTVKPETIAREIDVAIRAIDFCVNELDWDLNNNFRGRKYSKADRKKVKPRTRTISEVEEKRLLEHCDPLMKDIIEFQLITGMRIMEALSLSRDRVVGDTAIMNPEDHKGGYADTRYIPQDAQAILAKYPEGKYFFRIKGKRIAYMMFWRRFDKIKRLAGLPDIRPHDLRRTCGARTRQNYDLATAQSILGHKSRATTEQVYAPNSADTARNAFTAFERRSESDKIYINQEFTLQ